MRLSLSLIIGSQFIKVTMDVERKKQSKMRLTKGIRSSLKRNVQLIIIKINRCTILVKTFNYKVHRQHLWEEKLQMLIYNSGCSSPNRHRLSTGIYSTMSILPSNSKFNSSSLIKTDKNTFLHRCQSLSWIKSSWKGTKKEVLCLVDHQLSLKA